MLCLNNFFLKQKFFAFDISGSLTLCSQAVGVTKRGITNSLLTDSESTWSMPPPTPPTRAPLARRAATAPAGPSAHRSQPDNAHYSLVPVPLCPLHLTT